MIIKTYTPEEHPRYFTRCKEDNFYKTSTFDTFIDARVPESTATKQAIKRIVSELPQGVYIGGDWFYKSTRIDYGENYNINLYFKDEERFLEFIDYINIFCEEDSVFYGATQLLDLDEVDFCNNISSYPYLEFSLTNGASVKLHRIRWFDSLTDLADSFPITILQFAASKMNVVRRTRAVKDTRDKKLQLANLNWISQDNIGVLFDTILTFKQRGYDLNKSFWPTLFEAIGENYLQQKNTQTPTEDSHTDSVDSRFSDWYSVASGLVGSDYGIDYSNE